MCVFVCVYIRLCVCKRYVCVCVMRVGGDPTQIDFTIQDLNLIVGTT